MRDNVLKYTLAVSLLLNLSILGAAGYTHYRQTRHTSAPVGDGVLRPTPSGSVAQPHLFETLSLKPEQLSLFQERATLFHKALEKEKARVDGLRASLLGIMRTEKADRKTIETTIAEISRVQNEMQEMVVAHMLEFKSMLDSNQQKKFFDLIEGAMRGTKEMQCP
jgi:hypothetical protein